MTEDMATVDSSGPMVESMMVAGKLENNMVKAYLSLKMVLRNVVSGKTGKGSNGYLNNQLI